MTMRVLVLIVAALLTAQILTTQSAAALQRTRIAIVDEAPLVVRGTGFKAAERVTVTVSHGKAVYRRAGTASSTGVVVVRWKVAMATTCASTFVLAVGSEGSRATYKTVANDCAQPKAPDAVGEPGSDPLVLYPVDPTPRKNG
jgi:hypothetical protein